MRILFGSQTGTAQMMAEEIEEDALSKKIESSVIDLQDVEPKDIFTSPSDDDEVVVLVTACYGEGEPTDNARDFYEWLHSDAPLQEVPEEDRSKLRFTVFGLGNKASYPERYNVVGKAIEKRLLELGAQLIHPRGEGDAGGSIEEDFEEWKEELFKSFAASQTGESVCDNSTETEDIPSEERRKFKVELLSEEEQKTAPTRTFFRTTQLDKPIDARNPIYLHVTKIVDLCPGAARAKKELEVDIHNKPVSYRTGDHIGVFAKNCNEAVEKLAERLAIHDLNAKFEISSLLDNTPIPFVSSRDDPLTIRQVLEEFIDLNAPPKTSTIKLLAEHATRPEEKELLRDMSSPSNESYAEWIKKPMANIVDLLTQFPSVGLSWDHLIEAVPRIQPRFYSIASSHLVNPEIIRITMGHHILQVDPEKQFNGLCSDYLTRVREGEHMLSFVRPSTFKLPEDDRPCVFIVGGTGIAPIRGFMEEREHLIRQGKKVGPALLYYGIRDKTEYMYKDEIADALNNGVLSELHMAFSAVPQNSKFISQTLDEQSSKLWDLFSKSGANVYMCGPVAGFGESVNATLKKMFMENMGMSSEEEGTQFMQDMRSKGRIQEDLGC